MSQVRRTTVQPISPLAEENAETVQRGPRARMRRTLLTKAMEMMATGLTPSVAELAEAAEVSRATAYRYFPTQSALVAAVVDESLGPILEWKSESTDAVSRVDELLLHAFPRMEEYEVQLRAAILVSLQQGAQIRAGKGGNEEPLVRGHRIELLSAAASPLRDKLGEERFQRVLHALSLVYGTEVFLVLKDIWHLEIEEILQTVRWTARAILRHASTDE
jgi:AcrR family transcriptional regulator